MAPAPALEKTTYTVAEQETTYSVLKQVGDTVEIEIGQEMIDLYAASVELAAIYRFDLWTVYDELHRIYNGAPDIPIMHLANLALQIEEQTRNYEVREEVVERALALVRPEGFQKTLGEDGTEVYTAEIAYPVDRQGLLLSWEKLKQKNSKDFGFHYSPYNFDSNPEKSFFEQLLDHLNLYPAEVEDIYFTGALTTPDKTDFYVEYKGDDGKWHPYTPDFVIRRKDGKSLIVEIKDARFEASTNEDLRRGERGEAVITLEGQKAIALKKWENLNPDRLKYHIIFAKGDTIVYEHTKEAREFVEKGEAV
jgi:hypothetical protein